MEAVIPHDPFGVMSGKVSGCHFDPCRCVYPHDGRRPRIMAERGRLVVQTVVLFYETDISMAKRLGERARVDIIVEITSKDNILAVTSPCLQCSTEILVEEGPWITLSVLASEVPEMLSPDTAGALSLSAPSTFIRTIRRHNTN